MNVFFEGTPCVPPSYHATVHWFFKHLMPAVSGKKKENKEKNNKFTHHHLCHPICHHEYIIYLINDPDFCSIHLIILMKKSSLPYRAPKPILVSTLVQVRNDVANVLYAPTPAPWASLKNGWVMVIKSWQVYPIIHDIYMIIFSKI